jgi:hypothetical protein
MPVQVEVVFRRAADYRVIPATGAWGGVSPHGEVVFDLVVEASENPDQLVLEVEEGETPVEVSRSKTRVVRESQIGVVMRPDIAYSVGNFLIEKARQAGFTPPERGEE